MSMKLYDFAPSPNSRKVRAVAYELGITLEHVHVNLFKGEARAAAFLAKNPNGRVPVLEDGDLLLWESNAIIGYLAAGSPLVPTERRGRAEVARWLCWQLAHLAPATRMVAVERVVKKLTGGGEPDQAAIAAGTEEFGKLSAVLDRSLGDKPYLAGALSIADFALASHYSIAESAGLDVRPHERVHAWLGRMLSRDSMKRALSDAQKALENM
jgi:glutathione S-transferase